MKKLMFIALVALLMPILVSAQLSVSGIVTESNSKQTLAGASVSLNALSTQTNSSGEFAFKDLKPGTYTLRISFIGFKNMEQLVRLNENSVLNFVLERSTYLADEVLVRSTRATENSATTYRNLNKEELEKNNLGQDLPYLLNQTPSVVVTSDAGAGVGYTGIRIRGSDPTRVNVTINGIPYNDTESQGTFWVNLPDFASSVDNIQIQRGAGTSTNGAGAFGGSLNIQTTTRRDSAYAELNNSGGSFKTIKNTVNAGTGIIADRFSLDGRLSRIASDGYIDRASSKLKSYFLSGAYYGKKSLLRANVFSGTERTYQAWNGVPETLLETNRRFNQFTYSDQTDNYTQDHYQLLYSYAINPKFSFNTALHYTHGRGYFEEFKQGDKLDKYGIEPVSIGSAVITTSDMVRRRWLDNDFYGLTYSLNYAPGDHLNFTIAGAYNEYNGDHFGEVIKGQFVPVDLQQQRYYSGNGFKPDFNVYGKASYQVGKFNLNADLQYRSVYYTVTGTDKNRNTLDQTHALDFFNPKFGITYSLGNSNNLYASFAVANKEPNRDDYINSTPATLPRPENLKDIEAGYRFNRGIISGGVNGFAMLYKDQLISTGKINDVGEYIRQNVPDSYRIGLELDNRIQITNALSFSVTAALSRNRIKNFISYDDDYDNGGQLVRTFKNTDIALSPSFIGSGELSFLPSGNSEIAFLSKYVGTQFLDNTSDKNRSINPFFVNDIRLRYNIHSKYVKNIGMTLLVNNVFAEFYETNGYTFSYLSGGSYTTENYYYPQAARNFLLSLAIKF